MNHQIHHRAPERRMRTFPAKYPADVGAATFGASGNPAGLIVTSGMKIYGEASGRSKVEGRAKQTVKEIIDRLKTRFKEQGWID